MAGSVGSVDRASVVRLRCAMLFLAAVFRSLTMLVELRLGFIVGAIQPVDADFSERATTDGHRGSVADRHLTFAVERWHLIEDEAGLHRRQSVDMVQVS